MQPIPESHRDLLERPVVVSIATVMPDNQPQVNPIWVDLHEGNLRINTVDGRQKHTNLLERPQATFLVIDPDDPMRWMEIRGSVASRIVDGEIQVIDILAKKYLGEDIYPWHKEEDVRVTFLISPERVVTSG